MITDLLKIPYLRLKYRFFPNEAQKFWAEELIQSYGITAKFGQILLQGTKTAPPKASLSHADAKKILKKSFGIEADLATEVFTASMGQVFRATIDSEKFAVKILHPEIKNKIKKEIDHVILLGSFYAKTSGFHFDKDVFRRFLFEIFEQETDLVREGLFQKKCRKLFPEFIIPDVVSRYSNEVVLTQELVDAHLASDQGQIPDFAILDFFFKSLLTFGILHGDLNDRNWGHKDNNLVVYDFGCTQVVSERRRLGLTKLLLNQDVKKAFQEFGIRLEASPFKNREQELRDALFAPFMGVITSDQSFDLQKKFGNDIKVLREFCDPWILLMLRSLFSVIKVYQTRKQDIPMGKILSPLLILPSITGKATLIRIEVTEHGKSVVSLNLPISELDNLPNLIPDKVLKKIDVNLLIPTDKEKPQILFEQNIHPRTYKVWME